jgi:hypothetical protein
MYCIWVLNTCGESSATGLFIYKYEPVFLFGKLVERQGRKATGLKLYKLRSPGCLDKSRQPGFIFPG